jgi:hypothetical protein
MKNSDSTEMDRLLRRFARRKGETLPAMQDAGNDAATKPESSAHLDADEMNAYAENALPEAARSRYFAHLADCETCRKIVTELALAASISNEGKARVAALDSKPSTSWRKWLAAIFSPPVLRYGVPAMALFAVIVVVAIVAMRSQRDAGSVAQNKDESRYSPTTASPASQPATANTTMSGTIENHSNSNAVTLADEQGRTQPAVAATPLPPMENTPTEKDAPIASQETISKSAAPQADGARDKAGEYGIAGKREQAEVAAAPPPAPRQSPVLSAPAATEPQIRDSREEAKKAKDAGKDDTDEIAIKGRAASGRTFGGAIANKPEASEDRKDVGQAATTTARAAQNQARRRPAPAAKTGPADATTESERKESSPATSVGGRQFRKQGSAWVDIAYNSSRPTTNIHRGSEQYRALVADEPTLRTITQQLGGEVIVVWKSRAYRFY